MGHPRAAVVYTLAVGAMTELESVSGRKATILNPTRDDETAAVLRRRLFSAVDLSRAGSVVEQYRALWAANRDALSEKGRHARTAEDFTASYPFHPDVLDTLTSNRSTG